MTPPTRFCVLARYLLEQEVSCVRMEKAANSDTGHGKEWHRIAETLFALRAEHVERCGRCGGKG